MVPGELFPKWDNRRFISTRSFFLPGCFITAKWGRMSFKLSMIMMVRSWASEHPINSKEQLVNTRFKKRGSGALGSKFSGWP